MCTCLSKKKFAGESTEKAIYKMTAITECEILKLVHTVFPACNNKVIGIHTSVFCIKNTIGYVQNEFINVLSCKNSKWPPNVQIHVFLCCLH